MARALDEVLHEQVVGALLEHAALEHRPVELQARLGADRELRVTGGEIRHRVCFHCVVAFLNERGVLLWLRGSGRPGDVCRQTDRSSLAWRPLSLARWLRLGQTVLNRIQERMGARRMAVQVRIRVILLGFWLAAVAACGGSEGASGGAANRRRRRCTSSSSRTSRPRPRRKARWRSASRSSPRSASRAACASRSIRRRSSWRTPSRIEALAFGEVQMIATSLSLYRPADAEVPGVRPAVPVPEPAQPSSAFRRARRAASCSTTLDEHGILGLQFWHNGMKQFSGPRPLHRARRTRAGSSSASWSRTSCKPQIEASAAARRRWRSARSIRRCRRAPSTRKRTPGRTSTRRSSTKCSRT